MKFSKKLMALILVMVLSLTGVAFAEGEEVHITILATTDTHANLYGYAYENGAETNNNGMARISTYIKEVRASNPNTILIDNGDTYQGTILSDAVYNKRPDVINPVSKVFNYLEYDAMTLGNHEFNFGLSFVDKILAELEVPVLAANASYKEDGRDLALPYTIIEKAGVKVGIIGITNPNAPRWDDEKVADLNFAPVPETAKKYVEMIKDEVDVLVLAAHVGIEPEFYEDTGADGAKRILEEIPEIDVLMLGHFHLVIADSQGDTLIGGARNAGRDIVQFDLTLTKTEDGYDITNRAVKTVDMDGVEPDQEIRDLIGQEHQATLDFISGEGDSEDGSGGGIFGQASERFQPENEIKGIPEGKLQDTAVMDLINRIQLEVSGADVSAAALFSDTSDLEAGDINYGDLFNIYKFDNTLYTVEVTGAELKDYMEWSAQHYNTWKPGDISISFDADVPGYLYDMFEGVEYEVNLSKEAGERIENIIFNGEPLKEEQVLTLAVNNYRYSSGLKANNLVSAGRNWDSPMAIRDYIAQYIQEQGVIEPIVTNNWKITGVDLQYALRDEIIALVNDGVLDVPYNKALNIQDLEKEGIIVDGKIVGSEAETPEIEPVEPEEAEIEETAPEEESLKTVEYIVQKDDWLSKIAIKYGVDYMDIAKNNNIKNPNLIFPGQKLIITIK